MNNPTLIWLIFVLALSVFCLLKPNWGRIFIAFFFLVMAIGVNVLTALAAPSSYLEMGKNALLPAYRWLFENVIALNPALFVLIVAAYQIMIALLMLSKKQAVRLGLLGGAIFLTGIAPLGTESLPNIILAGTLLWLTTKDYHTSFLDGVRQILARRDGNAAD